MDFSTTWDVATETAVATALGYSVVPGGCCAESLWCDPTSKNCFTDDNSDSDYYSYPACINEGTGKDGHNVIACNPL
jgi:hypothetical protein